MKLRLVFVLAALLPLTSCLVDDDRGRGGYDHRDDHHDEHHDDHCDRDHGDHCYR